MSISEYTRLQISQVKRFPDLPATAAHNLFDRKRPDVFNIRLYGEKAPTNPDR